MGNYSEELYKKYKEYYARIFYKGIQDGTIRLYDEELIKKLRTIYEGGIPASIILLSNELSNGYCYDRALLLARAFLDTEDDIKLIYAEVDSIKLNPETNKDDDMYAEHCVLERTTKDGKCYIYDTSRGLIYNENIYLRLESPIIRKILGKKYIKETINKKMSENPNEFIPNPIKSTCIIPVVEEAYNNPNEIYTLQGKGILENEVRLFKKQINYDNVCRENIEEVKKLQLEINKVIKRTDN